MNSLVRSSSSSLRSLLTSSRDRCYGVFIAPYGKSGFQENFRGSTSTFESFEGQSSSVHAPGFPGNLRKDFESRFETGRNSNTRPMNFVRGILEEDGRIDSMFTPQLPKNNAEKNADIVHIKLMRNNTFITVTDSKGNTKLKASAGRLEELKGGPKLSRYAAEATAEYVGRESRKLGLKSVVMRVKGFTYFKKKKNAIMSWKEGFTESRDDQNPIICIEDTTRRPHNGCRLPKKRRI